MVEQLVVLTLFLVCVCVTGEQLALAPQASLAFLHHLTAMLTEH